MPTRPTLVATACLVLGTLSGLLLQCGPGGKSPANRITDSGATSDDAHANHDASADASVKDGGARDAPATDAISCSSHDACPKQLTCCSGKCVDPSRDPLNCGGCGIVCISRQFCTGKMCEDAIVSNVCDNAEGATVFDPYVADNQTASAIGAALAANCTPMTIHQVSQDDPGIIDPNSSRPLTGVGNTFIVGGGNYGQKAVTYMDSANLTTVNLKADGTNSGFINRKTARSIVMALNSDLTPHHDYFCVELAVEPVSGTLFFAGMGLYEPGTTAAGHWISTQMIPQRAMYTDAWYVYEFTDTNGDSIPNDGDTFVLVDHGR
jgi:Stigma-specific protein, Stig1